MSHLTFLALAFLFLVYSAVMLDTVRKYNKGTAQEAKVRKQRLNVARMGTVIALGLFVATRGSLRRWGRRCRCRQLGQCARHARA